MITTVPRDALTVGAWDAYVEAHPGGWFWHTTRWIDYCLAYDPLARDLSMALVDEAGAVVAVVPAVADADRWVRMGGTPCACPLGDTDYFLGLAHGRLLRAYADGLITGFSIRSQPGHPLREGGLVHVVTEAWPSYVVDLTQPENALWAGLRRSYRSLVRAAERGRTVVATADPRHVAVAHRLHAEAAGRETRVPRTWDLMGQWAAAGDAFTVLATGGDGFRWVGFAYVIRWKGHAYYMSGATLEDDVAHALQWHAMTTLKCGGVRTYEVGWAARPDDTDKARAIAFFKSGWGGAETPMQVWSWPLGAADLEAARDDPRRI